MPFYVITTCKTMHHEALRENGHSRWYIEFVLNKKGDYIEVNIVGKGAQNDKEVLIVGEAKTQLSKNNVNEFIRKKLKPLEGVHQNLFPVLVTYMISQPDTEEYARSKGIPVYYSYQLRPLVIL